MLETLIQSKTRLKLLLRFFVNPNSSAYLRGLAKEFDESTNSVRIELNRFEESGLLISHKQGNKKVFQANTKFPLYSELHNIAFKHLGIDQILDKMVNKLGVVEAVYLTGDLARGVDTEIVDISIIANEIKSEYLDKLIKKVEKLISRRIRTLVFSIDEIDKIEEPRLLIYGDEVLHLKEKKK